MALRDGAGRVLQGSGSNDNAVAIAMTWPETAAGAFWGLSPAGIRQEKDKRKCFHRLIFAVWRRWFHMTDVQKDLKLLHHQDVKDGKNH